MKERGIILYLMFFLLLPLITGFTLNPGQIHNPSPSIELAYSDAVNITKGTLYNGGGEIIRNYDAENFTDTSGNSKVFVVNLGLLTPGNYRFEVEKKESAPPYKNLGDDVVWFSYASGDIGLNLYLNGTNVLRATLSTASPTGTAVPETRFAKSKPYMINLSTSKPAWDCKYSSTRVTDPKYMALFSQTGTPNSPSKNHFIAQQDGSLIEPLIVWCNSSSGPSTQAFVVGYEDEPPTINATFYPNLIVDPLQMWTNLSITTNQKVYCEVSDGTDTHTSVEEYGLSKSDAGAYLQEPWIKVLFAEQPSNITVKHLNLSCWDRAGRATIKKLNITINLNKNPSIEQLAPEKYATAAPLIKLRVVKAGIPVKSARCFFGNGNLNLTGDLSSDDGVIYTQDTPALQDGSYNQEVTCIIANGERVNGNIDFILDTTPPPERTLTTPDILCGDEPLTASVNLSKYVVEDPNFSGYLYNITYSKGNIVMESGFQHGPELVASFTTEENETYKWRVWPVDLAGNKGRELSGLTKVIPPGSILCDHEAPVGVADVKQTLNGALVSITCDDGDGSGCTDNYRYDKLSANATAAQCTYSSTEPYGHNLTFYENGTLCYYVEDKNQNNDTGFQTISVEAELPNASSHCENGEFDEGLETGVDCGGQCSKACDPGDNCTLDADCQSGFCNESQECEVTSCTDAVKNGRETDVDCGGPSCPSCLKNSTCTGMNDCNTGLYCDNGVCKDLPKTSECDANSDCGGGEKCIDGVCVAVKKEECVSDSDCDVDEICEGGSCVFQEQSEKNSLLGIILVILGLLIMGGSGYWLYILRQQREESQSRPSFTASASSSGMARPVSRLTPEQQLALQKQRQAQIEAMKKRAKERQAEKEAERKKLLEKFRGKNEETGKSKNKGVVDEQEENVGEEFIDVRDIGQKEKKYTKSLAHSEEPVTRENPFKDLDEVIGDEKGKIGGEVKDKTLNKANPLKSGGEGDAFKELDEVIGEEGNGNGFSVRGEESSKEQGGRKQSGSGDGGSGEKTAGKEDQEPRSEANE